MTESPEDEGDSGPMSVVKQATLINYHLAIEDSVDIDKIWDVMQPIFNDDEQEDIQVCIGCVCWGGWVCLSACLSLCVQPGDRGKRGQRRDLGRHAAHL